jgi:hypothetical protein
MDELCRSFFLSVQIAVANTDNEHRMVVFAHLASAAALWLKDNSAHKRAAVADRLREIAISAGLLGKHTEDEVQAAMTAAFSAADASVQAQFRFPLLPFQSLAVGRDRRYLVKGLVPSTGLVVIWGPPKSGKSFLVFDLLMHVALNRKYRERRVQAGAVVYLALEGVEGFKARAEAFRSYHSVTGDVPFYLIGTPLNLVVDHAALIQSIRQQLGPRRRPVAIAVDTLNRSFPGSESKDEDMAAYLHAADAIRDAFNCVVAIVHHSGIDKNRPRGHTSLTGAADAQIKIQRDRAGNITMTLEWMKDGPEGDVVASRLKTITLGPDVDGDPITSCIVLPVDGIDVVEANATRSMPRAARITMQALKNALEKEGEAATPSSALPAGAKAVSIETWRRFAYGLGISHGDSRAQQQAFKRSSAQLVNDGAVGIKDDLAWLISEHGGEQANTS